MLVLLVPAASHRVAASHWNAADTIAGKAEGRSSTEAAVNTNAATDDSCTNTSSGNRKALSFTNLH